MGKRVKRNKRKHSAVLYGTTLDPTAKHTNKKAALPHPQQHPLTKAKLFQELGDGSNHNDDSSSSTSRCCCGMDGVSAVAPPPPPHLRNASVTDALQSQQWTVALVALRLAAEALFIHTIEADDDDATTTKNALSVESNNNSNNTDPRQIRKVLPRKRYRRPKLGTVQRWVRWAADAPPVVHVRLVGGILRLLSVVQKEESDKDGGGAAATNIVSDNLQKSVPDTNPGTVEIFQDDSDERPLTVRTLPGWKIPISERMTMKASENSSTKREAYAYDDGHSNECTRTNQTVSGETNNTEKIEKGTTSRPHPSIDHNVKSIDSKQSTTENSVSTHSESNTSTTEQSSRLALPSMSSRVLYRERGPDRTPPNHYDLLLHTSTDPHAIPWETSSPMPLRSAVPNVPGAFCVSGILSSRECQAFRNRIETLGMRPDHPTDRATPTGIEACEWFVDDTTILTPLWERVRPHIPATLTLPSSSILVPCGLNARWRCFRYGSEAVYRPHVDGSWPASIVVRDRRQALVYRTDPSRKSYMTLLLYLNDDFEGGETRFYQSGTTGPLSLTSTMAGSNDKDGDTGKFAHTASPDPELIVRGIVPRQGSFLCFPQANTASLVHEGSAVTSKDRCKYVIRTDVLYATAAPDDTV